MSQDKSYNRCKINDSKLSRRGFMSIVIDEKLYDAVKDTPIEVLGLTNRAHNCLKRSNITNVGEVIKLSRDELLSIPAMGDGSVYDIEKCISNYLNNIAELSTEEIADAVQQYKEQTAGILAQIEDKYLEIPIRELDITVRAYNCLTQAGYLKLGDLRNLRESKLYTLPGMGSDSVKSVLSAVEAFIDKPSFDTVAIEEVKDIVGLEEDYYQSDIFLESFREKIEVSFSSNEKNSMTFFDIWNDIGNDIPEQVVKKGLDRLVEEGAMTLNDGLYSYEFISILDAIKVLPAQYQECIQLRLSGMKYDEIGETKGVTRQRAQQMVAKGIYAVFNGAKGITPIHRVKEDNNRDIFQKYRIHLEDWVGFLKKDELEFRYLSIRYKKGEQGSGS